MKPIKKTCRKVQATLAESGPTALREDAAAQRHLEECDDCFRALEALAELERAFDVLPPIDAPDTLVERLLAHPELAEAPRPARTPRAVAPFLRRRWAGLAAGHWLGLAATVLVALGAVLVAFRGQRMVRAPGDFAASYGRQEPASSEGAEMKEEEASKLRALGYIGGGPASESEAEPSVDLPDVDDLVFGIPDGPPRDGANQPAAPASVPAPPSPPEAMSVPPRQSGAAVSTPSENGKTEIDSFGYAEKESLERNNESVDKLSEEARRLEDRLESLAKKDEKPSPKAKKVPIPDPTPRESQIPRRYLNEADAATDHRESSVEQDYGQRLDAGLDLDQPVWVGGKAPMTFRDETAGQESAAAAPPAQYRAGNLTEASPRSAMLESFLRGRSRIDGLSFKSAAGYWANTYVPGDPALRLLQARLLTSDPSVLAAYAPGKPRLHEASRSVAQPFDPPENAALAVYLQADQRNLTERSRLLVQVGLQATARHSGRRPAMNVGVVLDLRGSIDAATGASLRALVNAFEEAHDLGDRFSLVVAGYGGGLIVGPDEFRHGPLTVALQNLLSEASRNDTSVRAVSLQEALETAIGAVAATDDPNQPLGSSVVVLVTSQVLGIATPYLTERAHRSAVDGVPVSVVGVGDGVRLDELDRVALAGQGNRRLLAAPREAEPLVDRELSAVSRVVARAVRLRIRLAPGVELVDVVGSRRLDEVTAERVRQAEKSIDQRLARNLGIQADRGEDEEGIQIVIPAFYAADDHVVLLDVVAPGPGPIADVTVRYKDLVHSKNSIARDQLSIPRGRRGPGPLERNVLKSYLAWQLERHLLAAGSRLGQGDRDGAIALLSGIRELLAGVRDELAGFDKDRDLGRDLDMLSEYVGLLQAGAGDPQAPRELLADSLRYAGRLKVLPRSVAEESSSPQPPRPGAPPP